MKKILIVFAMLLITPVFAADKIHVEALGDFSTVNPVEKLRVKLVDDGSINSLHMISGDIINCSILKITDPTRAKRDAKIFFNLLTYEDSKGQHNFLDNYIGRYAKTVVNKEAIKSIPPKNVIKKVGGAVGDYFFQGISYGVSFIDGLITNPEENRLKSGVKQVYKDSFLSYIEYGEEIDIKTGDVFYLVVKKAKQKDIEAGNIDITEDDLN